MPDLSTFTLWKSHLQILFMSNNQGKLKNPLGNWIKDPHQIVKVECMTFHIPNQHIAIRINTTTWSIHPYKRSIYSTSYYTLNSTHTINNIILSNYYPIDFQRKDQHYMVKHGKTFRYQNTSIKVQNPEIYNFHEFLKPKNWSPLIRNVLT
jgi:hypothetical protein